MIELVASGDPDPEQQAYASELRDAMQREVESLPDAFRSVFVLRDVEGFSTAETSDTLGISEDLVKTRLHRARTQLRDNLYRRAGVTLESLYAFGNARCDRVVAAVMTRTAGGSPAGSPAAGRHVPPRAGEPPAIQPASGRRSSTAPVPATPSSR